MATENITQSRIGRILGIGIIVVFVILVVSGCSRLISRSFKGSQESGKQLASGDKKQEIKGAKNEESWYENSMCGVEFKYDNEKWKLEEDFLVHDEFGKVKIWCEDVEKLPNANTTLVVDKISGKFFKNDGGWRVVVNLPGGEVEWLMEGDKKAVEEMAKLVKFVRMPER